MSFNNKSEKYLKARGSLPRNVHAIYDQLVEEYMFHTKKRHGRGYVAYSVLADLVRDGWRPPEKAEEKETTK